MFPWQVVDEKQVGLPSQVWKSHVGLCTHVGVFLQVAVQQHVGWASQVGPAALQLGDSMQVLVPTQVGNCEQVLKVPQVGMPA